MTTIIILNGPPRSGKDSIANALVSMSELTGLYAPNSIETIKYANYLKTMTHRLYGLSLDPLAYEDVKDIPNDDFWGLTPRQAYINVSEKYIKPVHGHDFFGRQLCKEIQARPNYEDKVFVVTDGGFLEELLPLVNVFGASSINVVYTARPDCNFDNDSRDYLPKEVLRELGVSLPEPIVNDGSIVEAALRLSSYIRKAKLKLDINRVKAEVS